MKKIRNMYKYIINRWQSVLTIFISLLFGVFFVLIDSVVTVLFFTGGNLREDFFSGDLNVIWKRTLVLFVMLLSGVMLIIMQQRGRRFKRELHESRELFKSIFELSLTGIIISDKDGKFIRVNPYCSTLLGYTEEELIRMNFIHITHPDDLEADLHLLEKLKHDEIPSFRMEKRYMHKERGYIWVTISVSPIKDFTGAHLYYVVHVQPYSELNETSIIDTSIRNKALYEKNRAYQDMNQIFNSIGISICLIDRDHRIARANDAFMRLFRITKEDLALHKCFDIMPEMICMTKKCPLNIIMTGSNCEFESQKILDDGSSAILLVTGNPFLSPEGEKLGVMLSFTDITELRKLEKKITDVSELERQNLGQILHDELGQLLTGVSFRIESLKQLIHEKEYPEKDDIDEISFLIKKIQEHIRRILIGLFPVDIKYDRLMVALKDLASETERIFGVSCSVSSADDYQITDYSEISQLMYIARESVNNALKHAGADTISIRLGVKNGIFTMEIDNNGMIDPSLPGRANGLGLRIMDYRAKLIGAKFEWLIEGKTFRSMVQKDLNLIRSVKT